MWGPFTSFKIINENKNDYLKSIFTNILNSNKYFICRSIENTYTYININVNHNHSFDISIFCIIASVEK